MLFSDCLPTYASCMMISGARTEQLSITAGFLPSHWLYEWFSSADICVLHDDLGWKNWTICYNRFWRAGCSQIQWTWWWQSAPTECCC